MVTVTLISSLTKLKVTDIITTIDIHYKSMDSPARFIFI